MSFEIPPELLQPPPEAQQKTSVWVILGGAAFIVFFVAMAYALLEVLNVAPYFSLILESNFWVGGEAHQVILVVVLIVGLGFLALLLWWWLISGRKHAKSKHRPMSIVIEKADGTRFLATGDDCETRWSSTRTKLRREYREFIYCKAFKITPLPPRGTEEQL